MIKMYARKPVRDFLNAVTEPPYSLPTDKHNKFFESILCVTRTNRPFVGS